VKRFLFPLSCLALTFGPVAAATEELRAPHEVAITIDDLVLNGPDLPLGRVQVLTTKLLAGLARNGMPAVAFVNESKLYREGEVDARIALLRAWRDGGAELGNHTFSHPSLHTTPLAAFEEDVVKGDTVTRLILAEKGAKPRWFRHPYLQTGPTKETKAAFEDFLSARGYRVAPVTIDTNDWMFATPFADARTRGDEAAAVRVKQAYLDYIGRMLDFYEDLERRVFGRTIRHVLLVHANELNADSLDAWAGLLRKRGYSFVSLERALEDPAYASPDAFLSPQGISWLHRWLYTKTGATRLKEEPDPPAFVQDAYAALKKR
jgi:peptidoglycan/xylan/chitin deacetylase (PgdA/CDA1 family)